VGCEGTDHHLIALFSTVAGNFTLATLRSREIFNEIKDLERVLKACWGRKPF
jgi:hypothetical protein